MAVTEKCMLPRTSPAQQGVSSSAIMDFVSAVETSGLELHSFMLLKQGSVVAEGWWAPYASDMPHMLFSLSKSFTSTAVGFAVSEGRLSVNDPVVSFFPELVTPEIRENMGAMRVKDLLTMTTGHAEDTMSKLGRDSRDNWVQGFLSTPIEHQPGTHFVYNSGATYMLSAIVQSVTGLTLIDFLTPRLFDPLGIENPTWASCPRGINVGGWGLSICTEDIAKFGQLYLQRGVWNGLQIIPADWVDEATQAQVSNGDMGESDWTQGYGYQFWRCRHKAYRGDGAFGQYCIVMPEQSAVLAVTSGVGDMQAVLNLVWAHLLPGLEGERSGTSDDANYRVLLDRLGQLSYEPPHGEGTRPASIPNQSSYELPSNSQDLKKVAISLAYHGPTLELWRGEVHQTFTCGDEQWVEGFDTVNKFRYVASATWKNSHTLQVNIRYLETPFTETVLCEFIDQRVRFSLSQNVSFGPTESPVLEGVRVDG